MNTENTKSRCKLEQLSPEQQDMLLDLARHCSLVDLAKSLKERGLDTSDSALSRFLQKKRAAVAVEHGKELAGSVEALAEQGRAGRLREGTLEVMRQQFFEKAAGGLGGEEAQVLYGALVAEEARVKELELEARKVAALEQQVRLQERRIEVEAMKARAALGRVRARVVGANGLKAGDGDGEEKVLREGEVARDGVALLGEGEPPKGGTTCALGGGGESSGNQDEAKRKLDPTVQKLFEAVKVVEGILNRGGDPGDRILEARGLLAEAVREGQKC